MSKTGVPLKLVGEDGNAYFILARARRALCRGGQEALCQEFHREATAGDYDHLLRTCMEWFDVDPGDDYEEEEDE